MARRSSRAAREAVLARSAARRSRRVVGWSGCLLALRGGLRSVMAWRGTRDSVAHVRPVQRRPRSAGAGRDFGPRRGPCGPSAAAAASRACGRDALVDTKSHMTPQPPAEPAPHAHPGRAPHTHDGPLDASHAHAHADVWLSDVSAGYGDRTALEHVTVAVEPGSLLAVVGPERRGQEHAAQADGRAAPAVVRPDRDPRRAGGPRGTPRRVRPAGRARGLGVPGDRRGRRDDGPLPAARADPPAGRGRPPRRPRRARAGRDGDAPADPDRAAVRRPAAARVPRPGARGGAGPVPPRRAGDRHRPDHPGAADGPPRGAGEARQDGRRHDPRPRLRRASASSRSSRSTGRSSPTARRTSSSTPTSSRAPTAGTCSCSADGRVLLDDAHHHDDAAPGERHFHERGR